MRLTLAAVTVLVVSSTAAADPAPPTYGVGFRIGGYGFRREGAPSSSSWNECRMNGVGVFADRTVRGPVFVEAGLDTYFTAGQPPAGDLPIDRQSALVSVAAGLRSSLTPWLRGYAELGAGVELTRLSVPYGDTTIRDARALPDGFIGIGGDLRLGRATYLGMNVRTHVMANFTYDPQRLQMSNPWVAQPSASAVFSASPGFAAQAQFYVRRDL